MKLNLSNIRGDRTAPMTINISEYYGTYLEVCETLGIEPKLEVSDIEKAHNQARALLSEYLRRFPGKKGDYPSVALPLDEHTHYIAQLHEDEQVRIGIIPNKMLSHLGIGGKGTHECEN